MLLLSNSRACCPVAQLLGRTVSKSYRSVRSLLIMSLNLQTSQNVAYGVLYSPSTAVSAPSITLQDLQSKHIKYVRIQWVDLTNTVRFRVLPLNYFHKLLSTSARPAICLAKVTLGIVGLSVARGFEATGEYVYVPDMSSFRICPYAPGHASIMGWFQEKTPSPSGDLSVNLCPRTLLKRIVNEAQAKAGVSFLIGFESEFILLNATSPELSFVNHADWSCSAKTRSGSVETTVLEEIADVLLAANIELQMYHAEAAPGQVSRILSSHGVMMLFNMIQYRALLFLRAIFMIRLPLRSDVASRSYMKSSPAPRTPRGSRRSRIHPRDHLQCSEQARPPRDLRTAASQRQLYVPRGSAAHMHFSVHSSKPPGPARPDARLAPTLTPTERSFLQSLITHLPAVCALTMPTAASYARVFDGIWSGGTYASWGTDQREAPVRLCGPPGHHHFELKKPAALMDEAERCAVGLENPGRLPKTIAEARMLLEVDLVLRSALGEDFVEGYVAVNEVSWIEVRRRTVADELWLMLKALEDFLNAKTDEATVARLVTYY
ncbi:Protein fluG [Grifola frondosa]|uniref:Glutamine synthetase n=1 Tax=Grifola frondosa TaxID=5627 RepID=A0A1C7MML8_GRIFR|nr:Protein fluG [Grifola frondosa]